MRYIKYIWNIYTHTHTIRINSTYIYTYKEKIYVSVNK